MTQSDLRKWQARMGFTFDTAARALGVSRATYAGLMAGVCRTTGKPKEIDRRTALACAALQAGIEPIGAQS